MVHEPTRKSPDGPVAGLLNVAIPGLAANRVYTRFSATAVQIDHDPRQKQFGFTVTATAQVDADDPATTPLHLHLPRQSATATNRIVTLEFLSQTWTLQEGTAIAIDYDEHQEVTIRVIDKKNGAHSTSGYRLEPQSYLTAVDRQIP